MQTPLQIKWAPLLLAVVLCDAATAESLSSKSLASLKNKSVIVYMSEEQAGITRIVGTPSSDAAPITSSTDSERLSAFLSRDIRPGSYRKDAGLPPEGSSILPSGFRKLNASMADGAFFDSITRITAAPFMKKTWFNVIEISKEVINVSKGQLRNLIKGRRKRHEPMPDSAIVVSNHFVFGDDFYKLWFITRIEIYDLMAMGAPTRPSVELKKIHLEKFVSLYDIRDHFESALAASKTGGCCPEEVLELWKKDGGKLYFDTVSRLAAQNAEMIKRFLVDQPPSDTAPNTAIMALYAIEKRAAERHVTSRQQQKAAENVTWEQRQLEQHVGKLAKMNPVQRKAYMLRKDYEYLCLVDVAETTAEHVIARDLDRDIYYSLPARNMKLIKESEVDAGEYADTVLKYQAQEMRKAGAIAQGRERKKNPGLYRRHAATTAEDSGSDTPDMKDHDAETPAADAAPAQP
ncbi:MAG TPA: hypothetical protein VFX02_10815 [Gammaproteobacteria bacterium]|nr:hypothetical protein [Gammaproteobacteria bacterium]